MKTDPKGATLLATQILLIIAFLICPDAQSFSTPDFFKIVLIAITGFGLFLMLIAAVQLNKNLSPLPSPRSKSELIQTGAYKYIRHPIYSGIAISAFAWSLKDGNALRLLISVALLSLLYVKAKYEEKLLSNAFENYPAYQAKTGMLMPKIAKRGSD